MARIVHNLCDFCGGPHELEGEDCSSDYFTVKILKKLAKKKIGIIKFMYNAGYDYSFTKTEKYDMCPKCYELLVDMCKMNAHLPTAHYKAKRNAQ